MTLPSLLLNLFKQKPKPSRRELILEELESLKWYENDEARELEDALNQELLLCDVHELLYDVTK